jgi:hypothetical protein
LRILAEEGLLKGNTVAIDGTRLEANAALRSIVKRDNGWPFATCCLMRNGYR